MAAVPDVIVLMVFKQPIHVDWLLARLMGQGAHVVLHVDRKALPAFTPFFKRWRGEPALHLVPDPVVVNWAGFSQVRATLRCLRLALERVPAFRHLHLMSGECLPLRPLDQIADAMEGATRAGESDLIESRRFPSLDWRINRFNILGEHPRNREWLYNAAFLRARNLQVRLGLPARSNFSPEEILYGSQWWSAHRCTVQQMMGWPGLADFIRSFAWTRCADEHFFQMLHHRLGLRAAGSGRYFDIPLGVASPRYLSSDELPRLRDQGHLFARKVAPEVAQGYDPNAVGPGA
jgi:hypothetical protein